MTPTSLVVCILGFVLALCVAAIGVLALHGTPAPDVLQNVAVGSLTGLVGVLVPTRSTRAAP